MNPGTRATSLPAGRSTGAVASAGARPRPQGASFADLLARYRLGGLVKARADLASSAVVRPGVAAPIPAPAAGATALVAGAPKVGELAPSGAAAAVGRPMELAEFPRPVGDNGRGMHWVPIPWTTDAVVDRFVSEAEKMGVKWMVLLNDGTKIGDNDYLVKRLVEKGIMPIMRIYTPNVRPIEGDLEGLVRHYRALGVHYFQLYNEPNNNGENPDGVPNVNRYLDHWIPAARAVVAGGGLPGFGSLSPGGNFDDMEFLKQALDGIKARGATPVLDRAWISLHNYLLNHPVDYMKDSNGFLKFRWYDGVIREKLGRSMPIIGTEGGAFVGTQEDRTYPAVSPQQQVDLVLGAYDATQRRQHPYYLAYTYWVIANEEGGGHDPNWTKHALFQPGKVSPLVEALQRTARRQKDEIR